ncbi:MAG: hypothetical protein AAF518_25295 [Spirochaetota bacterium]
MNFTESDVTRLLGEHKERLQSAFERFDNPNPSLSEIQTWMRKENIESPEVLQFVLERLGKGEKLEKKMS